MTNRNAPTNKLPYGIAAMRKLYRNYKARANKDGYDFDLTETQFMELTQGNCHYCNSLPTQILSGSNGSNDGSRQLNGDYLHNGIDRVDNSIGYIYANCVTCCKICNRAKREMTYHNFIVWLDNLISYRSIPRGLIDLDHKYYE